MAIRSQRGQEGPIDAPARRFRVCLLGDSSVECSYLPRLERPGPVLEAALSPRVRVSNPGANGESMKGYMEDDPHRYASFAGAGRFDLVVCRFGQNDRKTYNVDAFTDRWHALCDAIEADHPGAAIILETGQAFPPEHPLTTPDAEAIHVPFWAATRAVATERGYPLSDVHAAVWAEWVARESDLFADAGPPNAAGVQVAGAVLAPVVAGVLGL